VEYKRPRASRDVRATASGGFAEERAASQCQHNFAEPVVLRRSPSDSTLIRLGSMIDYNRSRGPNRIVD